MAIKYEKKKQGQNNVLYTLITAVLLCTVFLHMVSNFYRRTEEEAYENLHIQTKQIKDDLTLQLLSDRENLATMANFASKLYRDGEDYGLMFESFKPIGLIANIGILKPDNVFVTKAGEIDLNGLISFEEEKARGEYISGRVKDLTRDNYEIVRSAVPITLNGKTVGILYGVIKLDKIGQRYKEMAQTLDAQLFVYNKSDGELVINTIDNNLGNISFLKDRKYNEDYSYEQMVNSDKGFTSFMSAYRNENMHMHYSIIEELDWGIALARYDSQVFSSINVLTGNVFVVFSAMIGIIAIYIFVLMRSEKKRNYVNTYASEIRKILLETSGSKNDFDSALNQVCLFAGARSGMFFDSNGEDYNWVMPGFEKDVIPDEERTVFKAELCRYAAQLYAMNRKSVNVMCIKPNRHLMETNKEFYEFLNRYNIREVSFSAVINNTNQITVLGTVNPKSTRAACTLTEKVAVCFSIALHNKNYLDRTLHTATTDALTGAFNRVAYNRDLPQINQEQASDFSCIYVDVNELHMRNNKYGHAAGDEMLVYIANTLKEVFYGHSVYRMGGDEFLVFTKSLPPETVKEKITFFNEQLKIKEYNVAIGMAYRSKNTNTEEMLKEAEIRMYEAKAEFYQNKGKKAVKETKKEEYALLKTGIKEIDVLLSVLKEHYSGIYSVSLASDKAESILMPTELGYSESEDNYSVLFSRYISEMVDPDYRRPLMSFLNYDAIKNQLRTGKVPEILFRRTDGENLKLCVYGIGQSDNYVDDTLWVFEKN